MFPGFGPEANACQNALHFSNIIVPHAAFWNKMVTFFPGAGQMVSPSCNLLAGATLNKFSENFKNEIKPK